MKLIVFQTVAVRSELVHKIWLDDSTITVELDLESNDIVDIEYDTESEAKLDFNNAVAQWKAL